jgi:6,7-dimethyl-8-ribityllumazine synthase
MPHNDTLQELEADLNGAGLRIGIVIGRCNSIICENLLGACIAALGKYGVKQENITLTNVPGALEIPLMLQALACSGTYDALIALGAVVRGEKSYRFEVVCNECAAGITRVQLDSGIPVANGVLMTETDQQYGLTQYGAKAATTAVAMANLMQPFKLFRAALPARGVTA